MPRGRKPKTQTTKTTRRVRSVKTTSSRTSRVTPTAPQKKAAFRWVESYTSFLMGIVVVIVAALFIFSFIKQTHPVQQTTSTNTTTVTPAPTGVTQTMLAPKAKTYTVKSGDDLWSIAEDVYHSGYNWVDIARANHLVNPGIIHAGNVLVLPTVTPEPTTITPTPTITQQQVTNAITSKTYTVQKGDDLWNIAVRAYGDGYQWTKIAQANHLANPGLIFSGNILQIPR